MNKVFTSLFCFLVWAGVLAQVPTEVQFRVQKTPLVRILPVRDTLITGHYYKFHYYGKSTNRINKMFFTGGKITFTDSTFTIATQKDFIPGTIYNLRMYADSREVFKKGFSLAYPDSLPNATGLLKFWWSTGHRYGSTEAFLLKANDTVSAKKVQGAWVAIFAGKTNSVLNSNYKIDAFILKITTRDSTYVYDIKKPDYLRQAQSALEKISSGSIIELSNIRYHLKNTSNGTMGAGPFRMTINDL